jgi:hypothetical protein
MMIGLRQAQLKLDEEIEGVNRVSYNSVVDQ